MQGTGLNLGGGLKFGQGLQLQGGQLGQQPTGLGGGLQTGGLQLGQLTGQSGGLQLGQSAGGLKLNTPAPTAGGLNLGLSQQTNTGGLQLGQSTQGGLQSGQYAAPSGGLQLGQSGGPKLPSYSTATQPPQLSAGGLQLGGMNNVRGGLQSGTQSTQADGLQLGGLGLTLSTTKPASGLQLGGLNTQTTKPSGGPQLGNPVSSSGAPTLSGLATSQAKPGSLGTPSIGGLRGLNTTTTGGLPGSITSTAPGAPPPPSKKYTYKELEGLVNKWTLELQAQEKLFLQQAAQVNKWDTVLAENGDKIVDLNTEVDSVKSEQQRVDNELEMIQSQQKELNDLLDSLEQQVNHTPTHGGLHADMVRTRTFQMAESVDSQLKHMSNDLKRIIEQMNDSNTSTDEDNPFTQIVRILNAHTDSLGWIDHEAGLLRKKVDDVTKVTAKHREEQELSFRKLAYK